MIYKKRASLGNFLRKGDDFKDGDLLEIASEGRETQGEFGVQNIFLMKLTDKKEGNVALNQTSINGIIDAFGEDSLVWIGKKVRACKIKQNVAGKFIDVWYFSHPDAELTESGFVLPADKTEEEIPIIKSEEQEINPESIPF